MKALKVRKFFVVVFGFVLFCFGGVEECILNLFLNP